ncbi:Protein of unknown function [Fibrobacter sp. UWB16]|uniref:DUF2971 domain-containing protein n=1 Tax=Fibrobacter sp. UWB16 TaxID=1945874 RepID=UPI000BCBADE9|nr:DUF2971 domain-containing protein [Fibrobacter sp. UWB16]SOD15752.1 Protein of unknown function [Fibrobacter sp. UWB16]
MLNDMKKMYCEESDKFLYHYTKIDVLQHIFNDPNGVKVNLRFTDYHFLNDADEGIWFYNFLKNHKKDVVNIFEKENEREYCEFAIDNFLGYESYFYRLNEHYGKHYSFSLSEMKDSMQFWRQDYANENGVALRFNTELYKDKNNDLPYPVPELECVHYLGNDTMKQIFSEFIKIVTDEADLIKYKEEIDKDGEPIVDMQGASVLNRAPFWVIKNSVWKSEREWRLTKSVGALNRSVYNQEHEKSDFEQKFEVDEKCIPRYRMDIRNPFDEIILGPSFSDYYIDSVKVWLELHNYKDVDISKSLGHERRKI